MRELSRKGEWRTKYYNESCFNEIDFRIMEYREQISVHYSL